MSQEQIKEKADALNICVENYKEMEETMRSAIISAQRTSEEILKNAKNYLKEKEDKQE